MKLHTSEDSHRRSSESRRPEKKLHASKDSHCRSGESRRPEKKLHASKDSHRRSGESRRPENMLLIARTGCAGRSLVSGLRRNDGVLSVCQSFCYRFLIKFQTQVGAL